MAFHVGSDVLHLTKEMNTENIFFCVQDALTHRYELDTRDDSTNYSPASA